MGPWRQMALRGRSFAPTHYPSPPTVCAPGSEAPRQEQETRMARSMWRGAIQFGLVTIPVKLYLATEAKAGLSFNLLHKTCLTRVQLKTYCPFDDEYITRPDPLPRY